MSPAAGDQHGHDFAPTLSGLRVLVVEDDLLVASATQAMIETLDGTVVAIASSTVDALDSVLERTFDLALVNVRLHGRSTGNIVALLTTLGYPFLMTGSDGDASLSGFEDAPMIVKPYRLSHLGPMLIAALPQSPGTSSRTSSIDSHRG